MLDYFRNLIARFRASLRKEPEPRRMRLITKTKVAAVQPVGSSDLRNSFIGNNRTAGGSGQKVVPISPQIRRAAQLLGIDVSELSVDSIERGWRRQISSADVHPDLGGDAEKVILLTAAKAELLQWLEWHTPKLRQFVTSRKTVQG